VTETRRSADSGLHKGRSAKRSQGQQIGCCTQASLEVCAPFPKKHDILVQYNVDFVQIRKGGMRWCGMFRAFRDQVCPRCPRETGSAWQPSFPFRIWNRVRLSITDTPKSPGLISTPRLDLHTVGFSVRHHDNHTARVDASSGTLAQIFG
jgi:hypothetical protein